MTDEQYDLHTLHRRKICELERLAVKIKSAEEWAAIYVKIKLERLDSQIASLDRRIKSLRERARKERQRTLIFRTQRDKQQICGAYVYLWMDGDVVLYIGMSSVNDMRHNIGAHNEDAMRLRRNAKNYSTRIIDGLTAAEALELELRLIRVFQPAGNRRSISAKYGPLEQAEITSDDVQGVSTLAW
jgi:hypothetical protein